ncbi:MAG TPA: hydantoinase/oxoprolinase family protein [Longimicrobiales bacterium]|nr:hydantoinase/oxoprolinase family protein [Longimicrobiales bacterium]
MVICVAVDTGGTFTDVVLRTDNGVATLKLASTPDDPSAAVVTGVRAALEAATARQAGAPTLAHADVLMHGTTVATNALLEGRGARTALVTNRGFEDILAIGRQARPGLYALHGDRPPPLVPDELRIGVSGRLAPDGEELEPLDEADHERIRAALSGAGAESIAVVLLHSYANPAHERVVAEAVRGLGLPISVSSELLPEFREYERTATTVANACVSPIMSGYLARLAGSGVAQRIRVMGSGGGVLSLERAREAPAHTILSGPAGGVAAALHVAGRHDISNIMTFDMGGTSTDVSLCPGRPLHTRDFSVAGVPVALPMLDIHTVGAGGGSIARLDEGGALRVGPASAGAVPGPVCYGRGGTDITVTDANVALGRLPRAMGALQLDATLVTAPLQRLAADLGCTPAEAAEGVVAVVNAAMEGALRIISVERGHDPADFTLIPFGGAAGLHAVALAERLEIPQLLLPPAPGVLSAFGMLVAPVRKDVSRTVMLADPDDRQLMPIFRELEETARAAMALEELADADVVINRWVAARYRGQSHELTVPAVGWRDAFHDAHEQRFGFALRDAALEAVTLGVEATGPPPVVPAPELPLADGPTPGAGAGPVRFEGDVVEATFHERAALRAGHTVHGPAVLLEDTATFWLPPGWRLEVLADGSCICTR